MNDPLDQRERFEGQAAQREAGDEEAHVSMKISFGPSNMACRRRPAKASASTVDHALHESSVHPRCRPLPPAESGEITARGLPYEIFVGLRYLRAKRRNRTISLNTFVSVAGITLGVAALIGTVGIMTGFKEDIQAKILGTTAHIIVQDRMKDGMTDYDATPRRSRQSPRGCGDAIHPEAGDADHTKQAPKGSCFGVSILCGKAEVTELAQNFATGKS